MIAIVLAVVASVAAGVGAERRWGDGAQSAMAACMTFLLWVVVPFICFFTIVRLDFDAGVGGGLGLAYVSAAICALVAYAVATRVLRLGRPATGALVVMAVISNTGFLGIPLCTALLGREALGPAVAYDTLVNGPLVLVFAFAVGAALGTRAGETRGQRVRAFFVRNPPLLAVLAALVAPEAASPDVLYDAAAVLAFAVLPLGFFAMGVTLAAEAEEGVLAFPPPFTAPVAATIGVRLVVSPLVMLALSAAIVTVPDAYLIQAAMPSGVMGLVAAHTYGLDLRVASAAMAWTTTLAVAVALVAGIVV